MDERGTTNAKVEGSNPFVSSMEKTTETFWRDVPSVLTKQKIVHIHKIGGKPHKDFTIVEGEIPVICYNKITEKFEDVVNNRGYAYAARKRLKYKKK